MRSSIGRARLEAIVCCNTAATDYQGRCCRLLIQAERILDDNTWTNGPVRYTRSGRDTFSYFTIHTRDNYAPIEHPKRD
jgi:hypothetical protein